MKPAARWAVLAVVFALGLMVFSLLHSGGGVDPDTSVPRGQKAPTGPDPDAAALAAALKKARR